MPVARATAHLDTKQSTWTALAILAVAAALLGALFVGAAAGVIPKAPSNIGQDYISSQSRALSYTLP
jgi:hypothetical protein